MIQQQTIKTKEQVIDAKISLVDKEYLYLLTKDLCFQKICCSSHEIINSISLPKQKLNIDLKISFNLSPQDKFLCIYNETRQYGYVYHLSKNEIVLELDRGDYYTDKTLFPLQFLYHEGEVLFIHSTSWNMLHVTNLTSHKLLTERVNKYGKEYYLDYFYGSLHLSPKQDKLLSSGWFWQPASAMKFINLHHWIKDAVNEPETSNHYIVSMSYYWDRAVCWVNNNEIAYLYDPREEDASLEDVIELFKNIEITDNALKKSYLMYYNVPKKEITQAIPFEYSKNKYFESESLLFYNDQNHTLICSSPKQGTRITRLNGRVLYENRQLYIDNFNQTMKTSINIKEKEIAVIHFKKTQSIKQK